MRDQRKSSKLIFLIYMMIVAFTANVYAENKKMTVVIGNENVEFNIPEDPAKLEAFYKLVVEMYAQSESQNLKKDAVITDYMSQTGKLKDEIASLKLEILDLNDDLSTYMTLAESNKFYAGPLFGYGVSVNPLGHMITLGAQGTFVTNNFAISLSLPLHMQFPAFNVSFGMSASFQFRLK